MDCYKCSGKGFIVGYNTDSESTCITCHGSGKIPEEKSTTKMYGKSYIKKFLNTTPFDFGDKLEFVQSLDFVGHPTMEITLLRERSFFYIGQPKCKGRRWYKIPVDSFRDFKQHYNKVYNKRPIL